MTGNSRTGVLRHLINIHNIDIKKQPEAGTSKEVLKDQPVAKKPRTVADFLVPKQNLPEMISEMAIDGASIRFITRNKFIRDSMTARGFKLPNSENGVMKLVHEDYDDKKKKLIQEIQLKKENFSKFSMTIDEYVSVRRRRYFSINLHGGPSDPDMNLGKLKPKIL